MRRTSLIAAWFALTWERAVPLLWPALTWLASFAVLALLGVWEDVGDPWRAIYAVLTLLGAAWLIRRALTSFVPADSESIARRVEEDSGISARPHEALIDTPPTNDPVALNVWREHQKRMAARLKSARARRPKAAWAQIDRWAIRGSLTVMLCLSWFIAGPTAQDRLGEAFSLSPIIAGGESVTLDTWIDPPAYTGRAPVFLAEGENSIEVPAGSTFVARIAGSRRAPRLSRRDSAGTERAEPTSIGDSVWEARLVVPEDANLRLQAGAVRDTWTVSTIPDIVPVVRILAVPTATAIGELDLQFSVVDDYGAVRYALELRPEDDADAAWQEIEITPAGFADLDSDNGVRTLLETAQHPLAGSRVTIHVIAEDAAGQIGRSPEMGVTLPQRIFLDGLARSVAEQRRNVLSVQTEYEPLVDRPVILAGDVQPGPAYFSDEPARRIERAPATLQNVARALDAITDAPAYFFEDPVVYLGLRESLHRLQRSRDLEALGALEADLWQIALRAELGSLADAEAALRAAERALMEALARGADETELAALFEAFQMAMDNYMAALAREAAEDGRFAEGAGSPMDQAGVQELLDALRDAAELGNTADARQALAALGELLRNMQMQLTQDGEGGDQSDPVAEAIARALEELGDVIGEQRELQDQTFGLSQEQEGAGQPQSAGGQSGEQSAQQGGEMPQTLAENQGGASRSQQLAEMQADLADQLRQSQSALPGGGEDSLGQAAEAMQQSEDALMEGDAQAALDAQERALADLRAGAEELARELLERMEDGQGEFGETQEEDPLGRPSEGAFADGSGVEVPEEMSRARARDILEELRRRAAEAGRPQDELDYIERLLDRF
jgi:hypothetical protein